MALPGMPVSPLATEDPDDPVARLMAERQAALNYSADGGGGGGAPAPAPAMGTPTQTPAGPAIIQLPEQSVRVEGGQSTTKRTEMAPERLEQIQAQKDAGEAEIQAKLDQRNKVDVPKADNAAAEAQALYDEQSRYLNKLAEERAARDQAIAAKQAEYEQRRRQMETAAEGRATSFWADKGAPAAIFARFIVMAADHSHRMAGNDGPSPVSQSLDAALAQDRATKMQKFENSKEFLALAKEDVEAAKAAKAAKEAEIKDEHVVMTDGITKRFKAYAAKLGTAEAMAKADAEIAQLQQKQAKTLADQYKDADVETSYAGPKTTTTINTPSAAAAAKPPAPDEIRERESAKQTAGRTDELAKFIADNPAAWDKYRRIYGTHANADKWIKSVPLVGGLAQMAVGAASSAVKKVDPSIEELRPSVDDAIGRIEDAKLREAVTKIHSAMERQVTDTAKLSSKNPSDTELAAARAQLAISARSAREMADALKSKASDVKAVSAAVESPATPAPTGGAPAALGILMRAYDTGNREAIKQAAAAARAAGVPESTVAAFENGPKVRR